MRQQTETLIQPNGKVDDVRESCAGSEEAIEARRHRARCDNEKAERQVPTADVGFKGAGGLHLAFAPTNQQFELRPVESGRIGSRRFTAKRRKQRDEGYREEKHRWFDREQGESSPEPGNPIRTESEETGVQEQWANVKGLRRNRAASKRRAQSGEEGCYGSRIHDKLVSGAARRERR